MTEHLEDYSPFFLKDSILLINQTNIHILKVLNQKDKFLAILTILKIQTDLKKLLDEFTLKNKPKAIFKWLERVKEEEGL